MKRRERWQECQLPEIMQALPGQRTEFGMHGTGTTKAVSPDCLVLVHVTLIDAPQEVKVMLLRDKVEKAENASLDVGHKLAVQKNAKKPTRRAAQSARCAEFLKSR